ncbi:hypothetical protein AQUCO_00200244v1 [Aquilegia coerulea]|uniref:F-box domain-containing protein n=1 Tax=Aquilegia coerulea TaxID=218851 RepID=A0A2G5F2H2_AQUCA|nr:hypothetical protein AQUCO_00200244v1 [Aquilegia coerulea]
MPESIQSHIVSFLPMEDAIRTSILSKQWRNVCKTLTNLEFDIIDDYVKKRRHHNDHKDFKEAVNQILNSHDESNIEKFKASVDTSSVPHILDWISFAVHHNVKELDLRFYVFPRLEKLPCCFFTCHSLRVLRLQNTNLQLPTCTDFPKLKTLRLVWVNFYGEDPLTQLFSSCPVLEEFLIRDCSWESQGAVLNIFAPRLKSLTLYIVGPARAIKISASNLHKIIYKQGRYPPQISSDTLSSLKDASFELKYPFIGYANDTEIDVLSHNATKIVKGLHHVRKLYLGHGYIEYLTRFDQDLSASCPTSCGSLHDLKVHMYCTSNHVRAITFLLKSYPNLLTLSLDFLQPPHMNNNTEVFLPSQELSTDGILEHLKTVSIHKFEGSECELELVRYLLENANAMEEMNIICSLRIADTYRIVRDKCSMFTKGSSLAVISFSCR